MSENQVSTELVLNPSNPQEREMMIVEREFVTNQRMGQALSKSTLIPKDYQNNLPNCMVAIDMARRLGVGEIEVMQNLDVIHGRPTFRSKYLIARINTSNILKGRLRFVTEDLGEKDVEYEYTEWINGNKQRSTGTAHIHDYRCRAVGIERETNIELEGTWVSIEMAVKEGWYTKTGSKWKTIPDLMLTYRAASFWASINAPEATMGMMTSDEATDVSEKDITPGATTEKTVSAVQEMIKQKDAQDKEDEIQAESETVIEAGDIETVNEPSEAYTTIDTVLSMAETPDQVRSMDKMEEWSKLLPGESEKLRKEIDATLFDMQPPAE